MRDPFKIYVESIPNPSKIHPKSFPNPLKMYPKSTLGCGCAFGANRGGPGNEKGDPLSEMGVNSATILDQKYKKAPQGGPKGTKSPEKRHPKVYAQIYVEKAMKSMSKALKYALETYEMKKEKIKK